MDSFIQIFQTIDSNILYTVQSVGSFWHPVAVLLSDVIGSTMWLAPVVMIALVLIGKKRVALELLVIFVISAGLLWLVKHAISAPRPYFIDSSVIEYTKGLFATKDSYGMPSGHAFISTIVFGWLWIRHPKSHVISVGAPIIVLLVGLSRVFLGVHYPSQVLAGFLFGILMLWFFLWLDKKYFRPRGNYISRD